VLNAKKSFIKSVITFMVSVSISKHRKKNSYKHKKTGENSLTTTIVMVVPLQGENYCFLKND